MEGKVFILVLVVVTVLIRVTSGGHSDIGVEERAMFAENAEPVFYEPVKCLFSQKFT